ncbi:SPTC2-like protein [Mya arenaria]|uniref:serine C-palmitoyltransferase n=1 Tax=Mya arenaria TaxID=6604 RepID=A0ABY7FE51_MYAAR|nr:SPTC2-like protein [Mya arenaria]
MNGPHSSSNKLASEGGAVYKVWVLQLGAATEETLRYLFPPSILSEDGMLSMSKVTLNNKMVALTGKNGTVSINGKINGINGKSNGFHKNGISHKDGGAKVDDWKANYWESFEETPLLAAISTYICYGLLVLIGHIRDFLNNIGFLKVNACLEPKIPGFVPLFSTWESFYTRHVFRRVSDVLGVPVVSCPSARMNIIRRITHDYGWSYEVPKERFPVLNMGSYNYLGFSNTTGPCADAVTEATRKYGIISYNSRQELGTLDIHRDLDELVAEFLGTEAAITVPMGFATNSMNMPCLVSKGCLILSDELNHASLVLGSRHGKPGEAFTGGGDPRPTPHTSTMEEDTHCCRRRIQYGRINKLIRLKKKYKAYMYLDEAHSVGAMGPHGRGVVDYFGLNPRDIDIMMGTFTKSFGAAGGYIGGSKALINHLRLTSHMSVYSPATQPPVVQQVLSSMKIIMGKDGTLEGKRRIQQLKWNCRYFRRNLHERGYIIYGNKDSPVVPLLIFMPTKMAAFSRECIRRGLGVTVVGFPATPLSKTRARFCLSAAHTKEDIDEIT